MSGNAIATLLRRRFKVVFTSSVPAQVFRYGLAGGVSAAIYSSLYLVLAWSVFPAGRALMAVPFAFMAALIVGLATWGTPRPGLLAATLVPVMAGWAIVHGQHSAAYSALSWLSRSKSGSDDLPTELARVVAEALDAPRATVWMGGKELRAIGMWPEQEGEDECTTPSALGVLTSARTS